MDRTAKSGALKAKCTEHFRGGCQLRQWYMGLWDLAIPRSLKTLIRFKLRREWVVEPKWEGTEKQMIKISNTDFSFKKTS